MAATSFVLSVLSGPNAGAVIALPPGNHSIGGDENDSVLLDGIPGASLSVALKEGAMRILGSAPGNSFFDGQPITFGKSDKTQLPAVLRLGDETLVALARSEPLAPPRRSPVLQVLVTLAAFGVGLIGSTTLKFEMPTASAVVMPPVSPVKSVTVADATAVADVAAEFSRALDALDLEGLTLVHDGGVLRVSGHLPAEKIAILQDLRRDFESRHHSLPLLVSVHETVAQLAEQPFSVVSIWMGDRPEIRSSTGEILRTGDMSSDGWQVIDIAPEVVTLRQGKKITEVRF